jgi:hypothetical protein
MRKISAPWTITPTPAFTLVTFGGFGDGYFSVGLNGSYTPLTVGWGDGTIEPIYHKNGGLGHTYADNRAHAEALYLASPFTVPSGQ